jgi:predicted secreted hydrolase
MCAMGALPRLAILAAALVLAGPALAAAPPALRPVRLPRDHGAHPGFGVEWWYTTGTVRAAHGDSYFYFATVWAGGPGMVARVNVVDVTRDRVVLAKQYLALSHPAAGQTTLAANGLTIAWRRGPWTVSATVPGAGALRLTLTPLQPAMVHGRHGIIAQGPNGRSDYYSEPRLAARGVLTLGARRLAVSGLGWLDHQWGNFLGDSAAIHWNWFACQFADGRDLMLYQFIDSHDRPSGVQAGTLMLPGGRVVHLTRFTVTPLGHGIRPAGAHAVYPLRWRLRVPAARLVLTLHARARRSFIPMTLVPSFWEGSAAVTSGAPGGCTVESTREPFTGL